MPIVDTLTAAFFGIFLQPLLTMYGFAFAQVDNVTNSAGWSLVVFSLVVNVALSPLYRAMEGSGRAAAEVRRVMNADIARIKKHYSGRERYFYIRTIHRHYRYNPLKAAVGSGDLFLQVLAFFTAYRFLVDLQALRGSAFFAIADLAKPDGLLGGVNLLPVVMTLVNVASTLVYASDRRQRFAGFALAALFLVLLYQSPAGLVAYWTCNNLFSLVRNVVLRIRARSAARAPASLEGGSP